MNLHPTKSATFQLRGGRVHQPQPKRMGEVKAFEKKSGLADQANLKLKILDNYAETFRGLDDVKHTDFNTEDPGVVAISRGRGKARFSGAMQYDPEVLGEGPLDGVSLMEWDQPDGATTCFTRDKDGKGTVEDRDRSGNLVRRMHVNPNGTLTFDQFF